MSTKTSTSDAAAFATGSASATSCLIENHFFALLSRRYSWEGGWAKDIRVIAHRATLAVLFVIAWTATEAVLAGQSTAPTAPPDNTRLNSIDQLLRELKTRSSAATPHTPSVIQSPSLNMKFSFELPPAPLPMAPDVLGTKAVISNGPPRLMQHWRRARDLGQSPPQLVRMVSQFQTLSALAQLEAVQRAVNKIPYRLDPVWWKQADYWATASETLQRGGGDCEDLAIVKLQALRLLGFPVRSLYLSVGSSPSGDHAVLLVQLGPIWWALDDRVRMAVPAHQLKLFKPRISFAGDSAFVHGSEYRVTTSL